MKFHNVFVFLAVAWLSLPSAQGQPKTQLRADTVAAFDAYADALEQSLDQQLRSDQFFSAAVRPDWQSRLRQGEIEPQFTERSLQVSGGLIQDWTATMFVPGTSGREVVELLTDYDRHASLYQEVTTGEVLSRDGNKVRSRLRLSKHKVITVVLDTEHEIEIIDAGDKRWQLRSRSTRINEVRNAGAGDEQLLPEGEDSGFLWRMNAYWSIEETGDGVYVECRTATLTRGVPFGLGWVVNRFTLAVPRESLIATFTATRNELTRQAD